MILRGLPLPLVCCVAPAFAAPTGICIHSASPETSADKAECFEYEKVEKIADGYRFFQNGRPILITTYRFRAMIPYPKELAYTSPEYIALLDRYEKVAKDVPSSRVFLNHRILDMRSKTTIAKQQQEMHDTAGTITIGGNKCTAPQPGGFREGKMIIIHREGILKADPGLITDDIFRQLIALNPKFGETRVAQIAERRVWNPRLADTSASVVSIGHEEGTLEIPWKSLSKDDSQLISSWSDGSWKLSPPGFMDPTPEKGYRELVLRGGKFHGNAIIMGRSGDNITLATTSSQITLPIRIVAELSGMSAEDQTRIKTWTNEIIAARKAKAEPETQETLLTSVNTKEAVIRDVRAKVLQVFDDGVLASQFTGFLQTSKSSYRVTTTVTFQHPLKDEMVTEVIESDIEERPNGEDVREELCFITGNSEKLVDDQIVEIDALVPDGRHQYIAVTGAKKTVPKYTVK